MRFVSRVSVVRGGRALFYLPIESYLIRARCLSVCSVRIMKRNKNTNGSNKKRTVKVEEKEPTDIDTEVKPDSLDEEEQGFGGWLRSPDGMETMKLFVIANSIVMVTTLIYPNIQTVAAIVTDMIYGSDTLH
ncbi:hypothetical protein K1T71_008935 [Dendrolimus kikuchii]|uniref:Uncharacterized protein n=1 Tax=Dendrolimus kikuchii TaxID=765133 RepID=A0ACC1CW05_9NEOP|nr:hypothetical protein K1T71_008935 [Dendrolimus kikuchii]